MSGELAGCSLDDVVGLLVVVGVQTGVGEVVRVVEFAEMR